MGVHIPPTLLLMLGGTSLTAGRLCTPPIPWTSYLLGAMRASPFCVGPVSIINTGQGSQTSNFGATQAAAWAPRRPTHVLMEDFGINDCAIGPVSIAQATANFNAMVASYRAENPDVVIVHQTMSPASAADVNRANLASYYDNGLANAVLNDVLSLDNYNGTLLVPGGWPKPMTAGFTAGAVSATFSAWGGTWNPSDKNASVTLSNGNLTAYSGATDRGVRGTVSASSGLRYFDNTVVADADVATGIALAGSSLTAKIGVDTSCASIDVLGNVYGGSATVVANYGPYAVGQVMNVAVDFTLLRIWFGRDGVWLNGDPATGFAGQAISAGTYFPATSADNTGSSTLNTTTVYTGDGLHPLWTPFQTYSFPNIIAWAEEAMADFWGS